MEVPWQNLFFEMEMEEDGDLLNHEHKNSLLDDQETVLEEFLQQFALSPESESHSPSIIQNNSVTGFPNDKLLTKSNSSNHVINASHTTTPSSSYILPFHDSTGVAATCDQCCGPGRAKGANQTRKSRTSSESGDRIMAERKRRQDQSQRFIALSAIIPGLKKIDKASILKEAIAYIKHLQNRTRELEEHGPRKINVGSVSFIDKTDFKGTNSADCNGLNVALPELGARVLEKDVFIRIHCEKHEGVLLKILTHITSLDLSLVSKSVLPFGNCALYITIIAQMGDKYNVTVKDLLKSLRRVILQSPVA
ncbi:Transcription factor bHLH25 [Spatholobus suberectus]|nr:Transcription factor bHLH25 [Spatholobus suberectus]